ncbi:unnamed protein product [Clavelina lepadiformis]|uniref:PPM-type phosphatase domain-containing protein n=1 Tax=Clavelina lepadiformis TaxID=159417 RepID=A0ABP0GSR3_CLALP
MDLVLMEKFFHNYLEIHEVAVGSDGRLPFRLLSQRVSEDELEAECTGLALQHLKQSDCPDLLALLITRETTDSVLHGDLSTANKQNDDGVPYYDNAVLAHLMFSAIHETCKKWNEELPQTLLNHSVPLQSSDYGIRNTRRKMEDKHSIIPDLNILVGKKDVPIIQWYAVYDGHGGLDASTYAAKHLHLNFMKQENCHTDVDEALKKCIRKTDDDFCEKAKVENLRSGTTAVVAVITESTLHVAWVGDSQAVLVRNGHAMTIMNPHKPEREDEKQRIEELGGCIVWFGAWRVNGSLSVSRAIGDADHKPFISGEADTASVPLDGSEDFLILACDGFWDVFSETDVVKLVRDHLSETNDRATVTHTLCMKAKSEGSTDNITVLVIFLREDINLNEEGEKEELSKLKLTDEEQIEQQPGDNNVNANTNNNNDRTNSNLPNNKTNYDESANSLSMLHGFHVEPAEKIKIPHRLLVNFVKSVTEKKVEKPTILVTQSSPHTRLPHSVYNSRWTSSQVSPTFRRRDTRGSLLSLSTIESVTELSFNETKSNDDAKSANSLPLIHDVPPKARPERTSTTTSPYERNQAYRALGYRAPHIHSRGRAKIPYHASLVVTCQDDKLRSSSLNKRHSGSLPDALHGVSIKNGRVKNTEIAITNSLSPTIKHKQLKKVNHKVKIAHRGRQRSRSAF